MRPFMFLMACLLLAALTSVTMGAGKPFDLNVKNNPPGYRHVPGAPIGAGECDTIKVWNRTTHPKTMINAYTLNAQGVTTESANIAADSTYKFHIEKGDVKICTEIVKGQPCCTRIISSVPTLPQYALIILVGLIIVSGLLLWKRKRARAVA